MIFPILLIIHIIAGTITLISAAVAIASKLLDTAHTTHIWSGRFFLVGMGGIFITALGMASLRFNPPMLFISIFSFYFAWMGWRHAKNRRGQAFLADQIFTGLMSLLFIGMIAYGGYASFVLAQPFGYVIIIFGVIGILNGWQDFNYARQGGLKGKSRVAEHLSRMLGGTIAAITAFFVVNLPPSIFVWLLPTAVLTPIIVIWSRKINAGVRRRGMPVETSSRIELTPNTPRPK